jgi:ubiquinone/menaquinone biosynthesis C-methylase UbiE
MFSDPQKNIDQLDLHLGQVVADFGAGSGFYALAAALKVGESGRVYAVDIQKDLLVRIKNEARRRNLGNVEVIWGDIEKANGTRLKDGSTDWIILSNILFQIKEKQVCATEAVRILRPGGRVLIVDWTDSFGGLGPEQEAVISKDEAATLFSNIGLSVEKEVKAGEHHFGIIMIKK